jgi:ABC-type microcin C transport system duplicated ATPase subunit YejF
MKTVVAYYSLGGSSRKLAEARAKTLGAPVIAVEEVRKRNIVAAFSVGCFQAMQQKKAAVKPISDKITGCDRLIAFMPVWAGMPAPAFNSLAAALHKGQEVEVVLVSGSGKTQAEPKVKALLEAQGVKVLGVSDVKAPEKPPKTKK